MIYGRFVQTIPNNNKTFQTIFDETTFANVFSIMDESLLFADSSYVSIQEKYDMLLEGVIGDIFNAIKNAIKKFIEWVKNFFSKLFKRKSDVDEKCKKLKENLEKKLNRPLADAVEPMKEYLKKSQYVENGELTIILNDDWVSSILVEDPDLGTDFISKIFSIISNGYKKNIKDVIPDVDAEIAQIQTRIYSPDFRKFIESKGFSNEAVEEYIKKNIRCITFSTSDSDNDIESKLTQFKKARSSGGAFDYFSVEKKITKFADDVNKAVDSIKKDMNKLTKELHPDNSKGDETNDQKELKANYINCLNAVRDFFRKIASEFQEAYLQAKSVDIRNSQIQISIGVIIFNAMNSPVS